MNGRQREDEDLRASPSAGCFEPRVVTTDVSSTKDIRFRSLSTNIGHLSNRNFRQDIDTHSNPIFSGRRRSFELGLRNGEAHFFQGFVVLPSLYMTSQCMNNSSPLLSASPRLSQVKDQLTKKINSDEPYEA